MPNNLPKRIRSQRCLVWLLLTGGSLALSLGCEPTDDPAPDQSRSLVDLPLNSQLGVGEGKFIIAQGKLEPTSGIVVVAAAPGDQIRQIHFKAGDKVSTGDLLVTLASLEVRQAEIRAAQAKRMDLENQIEVAKSTATARLGAAKISLKSAQLTRLQSNLSQGELGQVERELTEAKRIMNDLREAANDPDVARLIGTATLNRQELSVQGAEQQKLLKMAQAKQAIEMADLSVAAAEQEVASASNALRVADGASQLAAMDEQLKVLELQLRNSELRSPINGQVISVDSSKGQPTTAAAIMQLADTREMVCLAEVDVADLGRVNMDAAVKVSSPALKKPLKGKVASISQVVGVPSLPNPNPMARSDWRSAIVKIAIDPADCAAAASRISLQADVDIAVNTSPVASSVQANKPSGE